MLGKDAKAISRSSLSHSLTLSLSHSLSLTHSLHLVIARAGCSQGRRDQGRAENSCSLVRRQGYDGGGEGGAQGRRSARLQRPLQLLSLQPATGTFKRERGWRDNGRERKRREGGREQGRKRAREGEWGDEREEHCNGGPRFTQGRGAS